MSATVKSLTANTKYYFRVQSAQVVSGKVVKGNYSKAVTVTTKAETKEETKITIIKSPGKVQNGKKATLKIQGAPNTEYKLFVYYPSKSGEAKGIGAVTSDSDGYASWTWTVGTRTTPGNHKITVKTGNQSYDLGAILETYKKNS